MTITAPHTYAEWVILLDKFENRIDDEAVIDAMHKGTLDWQAGVSERFSKRLVDAVNARMNSAIDRFDRDFKRSNGDEGRLVTSLLSLRKEYVSILNAMDISALPVEHKNAYVHLILDQANSTQQSLEQSSGQADRTGKMTSVIRNTPVNKF